MYTGRPIDFRVSSQVTEAERQSQSFLDIPDLDFTADLAQSSVLALGERKLFGHSEHVAEIRRGFT